MRRGISKTKIGIVIIVLISIVIGVPLSVQAVGAIAYILKEFGLDVIARIIAQNTLRSLSNNVINRVLTVGRDGGPALVTDWRQFVVRSSQRGENIFRSEIDYVTSGTIVPPIVCPGSRSLLNAIFGGGLVPGINIGSLVGSLRADHLNTFQTRVACTIPDAVYTTFLNDFEAGGGWETWDRLLQPQNNFYGLLAISLDELATQRSVSKRADEGETRSSGFLAQRGPCQGTGISARCEFLGQVITPAELLKAAGVETIDSSFEWLFTSDELSEVIAGLINFSFGLLNNWVSNLSGGIVIIDPAVNQATEVAAARQQAIDACVSDCSNFRTDQCQNEARALSCDSTGTASSSSSTCTGSVDPALLNACMANRDATQGTCSSLCTP